MDKALGLLGLMRIILHLEPYTNVYARKTCDELAQFIFGLTDY